ncbi:MAG: flavin-containing monooxygenase [Hyphomicrobiaceae bacterium]
MAAEDNGSQAAILPGSRFDAIIVGAGFAGLYMLHRLRQRGFSARVFETAPGVGGTWYWNRYPGARCDFESMQYSYQFDEDLQQDWVWKERFASQPEILSYIEHVAERFDLKRDIQFATRVSSATFDETADEWIVGTDRGQSLRARFFIMGVGCLSSANPPVLAGSGDFKGKIYCTWKWPHEQVAFSGQRVGVIGTGSSGVQAIPLIAEEAAHLTVFQRTPNYVVPAQNRPLPPEEIAEIKSDYGGFRARARQLPNLYVFSRHSDSALSVTPEERRARFEAQWELGGLQFLGAFGDLLTDREANKLITEFWREKIREIVEDQNVAELLTPKDEIFGCKRLVSGTGYYETFNRRNVDLVDVSGEGRIERLTADGLRAGGTDYPLDALVLATGFDAMTGSVVRIDIEGRGGLSIQNAWRDGPGNYIGLAIHGFPNMFNMAGPGGPSVLANMVACSEQHVEWVSDCMSYMRENGHTRIEATAEAQTSWGEEVAAAAKTSLRSTCNSWYIGANVEGKARVFMPYIGGFPKYEAFCDRVARNGYKGFELQ